MIYINKERKNIKVSKLIWVILSCMLLICICGCTSKEEDSKNAADNSISVSQGVISVVPVEEDTEESADSIERETDSKTDLIFFMGQSNMSGKGGDAQLAPSVSEQTGVEFRAYSDPTTFYPVSEPFGKREDNPDGLHEKDDDDKSGSLASAFINKYYELTGNKVIAVSISKGGLAMDLWLNGQFNPDIKHRIERTKEYLAEQQIVPEHTYVLWLQGESDTSREVPAEEYMGYFNEFFDGLFELGIEEVFIISPGMSSYESQYTGIIDAQKDICKNDARFCLATTVIKGLKDECFADSYHLNQHALNLTGIESAKAAAYYTNTGHKPVIYDYMTGDLFVPEGSADYTNESIGKISLKNVNEEF